MEESTSKPSNDNKAIFATAAGMLTHDIWVILLFYPVLVIGSIISILAPTTTPKISILLGILERIGQLSFIAFITIRWVRICSQTPRQINFSRMLRIISFGMAIWILFSIPFLAQFTDLPDAFKLSSFFILGIAVWLTLTLLFYPLPLLLESNTSNGLKIARQISKGESFLALKALLVPCAITSLILAIIYAPYPDGRSIITNIAAELSSGIFTLLLTYICLAISMYKIPELTWRAAGLDPYRANRFNTVAVQAPTILVNTLSIKNGIFVFILSILVWVGNLARLMELAPSADITVQDKKVIESQVTLTLTLNDPDYNFRGLHPIYFALAGERRAIISEHPEEAVIVTPQGEVQALSDISSGESQVQLRLIFKANRTDSELKALEDLYLWYRGVKIAKLNFN